MSMTIRQAIQNRLRVVLDYPPGRRIIEPHVMGYSKDRNLLLRAYQVSGASESGESEHWKLFRLDAAITITLTDDNFVGPRPLYNPDDSAMKGGIIERL